jgi:hypothetical protein
MLIAVISFDTIVVYNPCECRNCKVEENFSHNLTRD